jgi:hypothetical protein
MQVMGQNGRNGHLLRAERAVQRARPEFEQAKKSKDELQASQAAEKAWLAVAEATHALLRLKGVPEHKLPQGHQGVFQMLRRYGGEDMARTLVFVRGILHTEAFYRGAVEWRIVGEGLGQAEGFVARVRRLAEHRK